MMMTVVDNRGTYMVHSDASLVSQRKVDPHYSEIVNGKTANRDIVDLSTKPYYVHFSEVPEINWYVIAYQDQREVVSELINTMIGIVVGLLVLFVILMVLIGIMFNTIDKAVKQLRDSAKKVAEGRYDIRLSETPHEEFKQLFENFELMAKRIDNRENEITVLTNTLEENYYHTIIALARAIEAKDNYTGNHCERVRDYSLILGQELGLDSQAIRQLRYGSILHDIGKMGVDEAILNKTERLTDEEFARIKEHSTMGYNIIQNIPHMKSAKDIILYHHERFDGKGYPQQLTGFQIPLLARIVAIADAFDAMTSVRPYRDQTMTTQQAVIELKTHSGTQFDSEMVKAFIRAVEKNPDALPGHA